MIANDGHRRCHMFYPQRVVDIKDGKPKWTGLQNDSELMDENALNGEQSKEMEDADAGSKRKRADEKDEKL